MIFSCSGNLQNYRSIESAGFDGIILSGAEISSMSENELDHLEETISRGPVKCYSLNDFCPQEIKLCGDELNIETLKAYTGLLVRRASRLGIKQIGIGAPRSRIICDKSPHEKEINKLKNSLINICKIAEPYKIDILFEAVNSNDCNFITYTDEAFNIVNSIDLDNLHLVFDFYHAGIMEESAVPLQSIIEKIKIVHIACELDGKRVLPTDDLMQKYTYYVDALRRGRYYGEIGIEVEPSNDVSDLSASLQLIKTYFSER